MLCVDSNFRVYIEQPGWLTKAFAESPPQKEGQGEEGPEVPLPHLQGREGAAVGVGDQVGQQPPQMQLGNAVLSQQVEQKG